MSLPADLPKVLAFIRTDLRCLSSLRVVSRDAKDRVEARWWRENVLDMKHFVDQQAFLFSDHPEDLTLEERLTRFVSAQEAFARNVLKLVKPLLLKEPWRAAGAEEGASEADAEASEVTPQDAFGNLRRAFASLNWRQTELLRDIRQQARHIERRHLSRRHSSHTLVSLTDRRQIEGPTSAMFANLETTEMRSEDAVSDSLAHTEMTREPYANPELMMLFSQRGISDEQALDLLMGMHRRGYIAEAAFLDPSEDMRSIGEAASSHVAMSTGPSFLVGRGDDDHLLQELTHKDAATGETELHMAARRGVLLLVRVLLQAGAEKNARTVAGETPMHLAAQHDKNHCFVVQELLHAGADKDATTAAGKTALHLAIQNDNFHVVKQLLEAGADKDATTAAGETALHLAAEKGQQGVVQKLLQEGADLHAKTPAGETTLHLAARTGYWKVVMQLLEAGADNNAKTAAGDTALHLAAQEGHWDVVDCLLQSAEKNARTAAGDTALHLAARKGHWHVVWCLLRADVDKDATTAAGETAMHLAALKGRWDVVQKLLEASADKDATTAAGETALHLAVRNDSADVIHLLIESGAHTNAVTAAGATPLHLAAQEGHLTAVQKLLKEGADKNVRTAAGATALYLADQKGHQDVIESLTTDASSCSVM